MLLATPALQLTTTDCSADPDDPITIYTGQQPLTCLNGGIMQVLTLPPTSSNIALPFPLGVTTAVYVFIAALTTSDLHVNIGSSPFAMPISYRQGTLLYGLTSAQLSLSSVQGGQVQYSIGG